MKLLKKKLTKAEINAINNKIAYPEAIVFCPRCGQKLEYFPVGNAVEIRCPSKNCIKGSSSALLEICFIDDSDDMKLYSAKKNNIAQAIANGIVAGFGLKKSEPDKVSVDTLVNELSKRGILTDKTLWLKKFAEDSSAYWLGVKTLNFLKIKVFNLYDLL